MQLTKLISPKTHLFVFLNAHRFVLWIMQGAWKGGVGVALQLHELGDGRRDDSEDERTDAQSRHLRLSQSASRLYGRRDDGFCGRYGCLGRRVAACDHRPEFLLSSPLRPLACGQVSCVCCFRGAEQGGSSFFYPAARSRAKSGDAYTVPPLFSLS